MICLHRDRRAAAPLVDRPPGAIALRRRDLRSLRPLDLLAPRDTRPRPVGDRLRAARVPVPGRAVLFGVRRRATCLRFWSRSSAGTLTIPAVAWLARRTFGSGAGGVAAAFAALSGAHVAFSRMALTDASFLLVWVLALVQGQRFLERPCGIRAVLLGLAVGAAQLFKYNGWLAGAIVVLAAGRLARCSSWRVAIAAHGGYLGLGPPGGTCRRDGLLAMVCLRPITRRLRAHCWHTSAAIWAAWCHGRAISRPSLRRHGHSPAEPVWLAAAGLAAATAGSCSSASTSADRARGSPLIILAGTWPSAALRVDARPRMVGSARLAAVRFLRTGGSCTAKPVILLYSGWLTLLLLTPFYHPYARLWLPLQAFECVFLGGAIGVACRRIEADNERPNRTQSNSRRLSDLAGWLVSAAQRLS